MSRQVTSCHVMSRHVTSCHVTSCHVMSRHVTSRHVTSCPVMSRHVISCYVLSCRKSRDGHATNASLSTDFFHTQSIQIKHDRVRWLPRRLPIQYRISGIWSSYSFYFSIIYYWNMKLSLHFCIFVILNEKWFWIKWKVQKKYSVPEQEYYPCWDHSDSKKTTSWTNSSQT